MIQPDIRRYQMTIPTKVSREEELKCTPQPQVGVRGRLRLYINLGILVRDSEECDVTSNLISAALHCRCVHCYYPCHVRALPDPPLVVSS